MTRSHATPAETARYWARYPDRHGWAAGEKATTVVRRRILPDRVYDESFRTWGGWAPTATLYDIDDPRPSTVPHLVEISAADADLLLGDRFGVIGATGQAESAIETPELLAVEADSLRAHWDHLTRVAAATAKTLDELLDELPASWAARRVDLAHVKSPESVRRQVAVLCSEGVALPTALRVINDIIRFTVVLDADAYPEAVARITALLAARGCTPVPGSSADSRENPRYRDRRAVWTAPDDPARFEIQFHTAASLTIRERDQQLHDFARQSELWPADTHPGGAAFVRHSSWWCVPESPENGRAVAALLGYHTSEEALRDLVAAPTRLAYLLNFPTNDLHPLLQVRRLITAFVTGPPVPPVDDADAMAAATVALTSMLRSEIGESDGSAVIFGVPHPTADDAVLEIRRAARLLIGAAVVRRGDLDGQRCPRAAAPAGSKAEVVAALLGLAEAESVYREPALAARRLAYLLGIPARNPTALRVLASVLEVFVEQARIPPLGHTDELVVQTDRVAGAATPADSELYRTAAKGLGISDLSADGAGIYRICSHAAVFLFKAVLIRRID
ncbi:hypothetical protein [Nocardia otitidiscaviarum]|uniref:hypothetical protein n=1 Tax=Nocardia otitidiscaviarum TaxID=1823 RepID=UPI0018930223|nr:hypothetical protein [Nocardia otitidiscaviarum]MBF6177386.1 hypothetical protein [Nocardia otitidiscaviarum]